MSHNSDMKSDSVTIASGRYTVWFLERARDTGGRRLVTEWAVDAYTGPPLHWHPTMRESWEVLQGSMIVTIDGVERRLTAGDSAVAHAGVRHTFRKDGAGTLRWRQTNEPALDHELLFILDHRRAERSGPDGRPGPIESIRILALMDGFVEGPPLWLQRLLVAIGNLLNRRLRARAAIE